MTVNYNCEENNILINPPIKGLISFGVKKGCSENITTEVYCQENIYSNFLEAQCYYNNYTLGYDLNCDDPPGTGCNTCPQFAEFSYGFNLDLSQVTAVSGTVTIEEDGSVVSTTNINNLSYFTNTHSFQTYYYFLIKYELTFTCTNGITFNIVSRIFSNGQSCDLESVGTTNEFNYDCLNSYVNTERPTLFANISASL